MHFAKVYGLNLGVPDSEGLIRCTHLSIQYKTTETKGSLLVCSIKEIPLVIQSKHPRQFRSLFLCITTHTNYIYLSISHHTHTLKSHALNPSHREIPKHQHHFLYSVVPRLDFSKKDSDFLGK